MSALVCKVPLTSRTSQTGDLSIREAVMSAAPRLPFTGEKAMLFEHFEALGWHRERGCDDAVDGSSLKWCFSVPMPTEGKQSKKRKTKIKHKTPAWSVSRGKNGKEKENPVYHWEHVWPYIRSKRSNGE